MFRTSMITLLCLPLAACAADVVVDDLADETEEAADAAGKADGNDTFTYYRITPDYRRCAAPLCGGFHVERVNRAKTTCADGTRAASCYVAELDASLLAAGERVRGLVHEGRSVIVRGEIEDLTFADWGNLGRLRATEAWIAGAAAGEPDGIFVRVEQTGIRCVAAPCADKAEYKLNSSLSARIADVDFTPSGATDAELEHAYAGLLGEADGGGLIIVGDRYRVSGPAGRAKARTATQFYRPVVAEAPAGECFVGGCSGQICSDQEGVVSTCEWRPEYACYDGATCERQADGACGWTETPELLACLGDPSQQG